MLLPHASVPPRKQPLALAMASALATLMALPAPPFADTAWCLNPNLLRTYTVTALGAPHRQPNQPTYYVPPRHRSIAHAADIVAAHFLKPNDANVYANPCVRSLRCGLQVFLWDPCTMNVLGPPLKAMDKKAVDATVAKARFASNKWKVRCFALVLGVRLWWT